MGTPRGAAQARPAHAVSTTPVAAGSLRVIGEGRPLEPGFRQAMESLFRADFSGVRVHEGPAARAMGALAFTLGEQLHFAPGLYDPESREGVALLGHELTHVVQQRDGRVANPHGRGVAIVQDPALETEADEMGRWVANQLWPDPKGEPFHRLVTSPRRPTSPHPVQSPRVAGKPFPPEPWILASRPASSATVSSAQAARRMAGKARARPAHGGGAALRSRWPVVQRMEQTTRQTESTGGVELEQLRLKHGAGAEFQQVIQWRLAREIGRRSGYIVQSISLWFEGNLIETYYEAWKVSHGVVEGGQEGATDQFTFGPFKDNASGMVIATAAFLETSEPDGWSRTKIKRANGLRASSDPPAHWPGTGYSRIVRWKTGNQGTYEISLNGKIVASTLPVIDPYEGGVSAPYWQNQIAATKIWFELNSEASREVKRARLRFLLSEDIHASFSDLVPAIDSVLDSGRVEEFLDDLLETYE